MAKIQKRTRIIKPLGSSSNSEVVTARDSAIYGVFASLDARLEALETVVDTSNHSAPTLSGNLVNVLDISASTVFTFDTQLQNLALLSPVAATGEPSFRAIVAADLPSSVVYDTITLTAGLGLTGGGDLSANRTFNVGAGAGITVNADDVALTTPGTLTSTSINASAGNHTHAIDGTIAIDTDLHSAVTLGADVAPLMSIGAGQILTFDTQSANTVLAGPVSGGAADPTMRLLVFADIPSSADPGAAEFILASTSAGGLTLRNFIVESATDVNSITLSGVNDSATTPDIQFVGTGLIAVETSFGLMIDSDNNGTSEELQVWINGNNTTSATKIFHIDESSSAVLNGNAGSAEFFCDGASGFVKGYKFGTAGVDRGGMIFDASDDLRIINEEISGSIIMKVTMTDATQPALSWRENGTNIAALDLSLAVNGTKLTLGGEITIEGKGASGGNTRIGIGVGSPAAPLHIVSDVNELLALDHSSTTGSPFISFLQSGTRRGFLQYDDSGDEMRLVSEYGGIHLKTGTGGTEVLRVDIRPDGTCVFGSPSGITTGAGNINAPNVYDDGTLLTDRIFELDYQLKTIQEMQVFYEENKHLPTIPGRITWEKEGKFSLGHLSNYLWETVEVQAIYISQLHKRLNKIEDS